MKSWTVFVVLFILVACFVGHFYEGPNTQAICSMSNQEGVCADEARVSEVSEITDETAEALESFSDEGVFSCSFAGDCSDAEREMNELGIQSRAELRSFVTASPLTSLCEPLSAQEFSRLLYLLVSEFDPDVPIQARLQRVTFVKDGDSLLLYAEAEVYLSRFSKAYHVGLLPDVAVFSALVPIMIKKSEISVDYNNLYLQCDNKNIPELLLRYGCNALFGEKDYKRFFGEVVGNLVENACFSG